MQATLEMGKRVLGDGQKGSVNVSSFRPFWGIKRLRKGGVLEGGSIINQENAQEKGQQVTTKRPKGLRRRDGGKKGITGEGERKCSQGQERMGKNANKPTKNKCVLVSYGDSGRTEENRKTENWEQGKLGEHIRRERKKDQLRVRGRVELGGHGTGGSLAFWKTEAKMSQGRDL